jgi:hypothetical protein
LLEETKESWTAFNGEHPLEPEIEGLLMYLSSDHVCIQETNHPIVVDMYGTIEENIQSDLNEQVNQEYHDLIEP